MRGDDADRSNRAKQCAAIGIAVVVVCQKSDRLWQNLPTVVAVRIAETAASLTTARFAAHLVERSL